MDNTTASTAKLGALGIARMMLSGNNRVASGVGARSAMCLPDTLAGDPHDVHALVPAALVVPQR